MVVADEAYPAIEFSRNPLAGEVLFEIESSENLTHWSADQSDLILVGVQNVNEGLQQVTMRRGTPISETSKQFFRLRATLQSPKL